MFGLMTKAAHEAARAYWIGRLADAHSKARRLNERLIEVENERDAALAKIARMTGNLCRGKVKPGSAQAVN